jgi:integrase
MEHQILSPGVVEFKVGGRPVLVDQDIFENLVVHYKWHLRSGYVTAWSPMKEGKRTLLFLHREIMKPAPDQEVHFGPNPSPLDNRRANLKCEAPHENKHWSQRKPKTIQQQLKGLYKMSGSQNWWFRYTQNGQRLAVALRTPDAAEAIKRATIVLAEGLIAAAAYTPGEPAPRKREIHGLIEQYLKDAQNRHKKPLRSGTADTRRYVLNKFVVDCSIDRVHDITLPQIQRWLVRLKNEGKTADTCWTYGQRVRSFITYLVPKYLPSTVLSEFTVPEPSTVGRHNWIRSAEITKILDAAGNDLDLKFALFCGFDAGLRRSEISEARVCWFDLENGLLHVSNKGDFVTKDRSNRTIPLTDRFAEFLKGYLAGRESGQYVLAPGKTVKGANKYRYDTSKRVRSHFERCKVSSSFHDMRRSFGSNRASAGVSIYKIAAWLGDGIEVVQRSYGYLAPQDREVNKGV